MKVLIKLHRTSIACPEQYDAYLNDKQVGYLRLRHGSFTVECPDVGKTMVFEGCPLGDGCFIDGERDYYLKCAVKAIENWLEYGHARVPPDVKYEII